MKVQDKEIEIVDTNYTYKFINERECKTKIKIIMNIPPSIDKYTYNINNMIYDLKVTDNKGDELPLVDNETSITILLFPSKKLSESRYDNFEINISYIVFNNSQFKGFFKDSIEYKEFLIGNKFNLIEIIVPEDYNIDVETLNINSIESGHINNKTIPFKFVLKDPKHIVIRLISQSKMESTVLTWKIIINKINLNWMRFGFYGWAFIISGLPVAAFFLVASEIPVVGLLGGLLASLLTIRARFRSEISLVERWSNIYIWMLVLVAVEAIFLIFIIFRLRSS